MKESGRSRSFRRWVRRRAMARKIRLVRNTWLNGPRLVDEVWGEREIGQLAKGKVHCSCRSCRGWLREGAERKDSAARLGMAEEILDEVGER